MLSAKFVKNTLLNRGTLLAFALVVNVFSWYFPLNIYLTNTLNNLGIEYAGLLIVFGAHYGAMLLSGIIGTSLMEKIVSRNTLLSVWMLLGAVLSGLVILLTAGDLPSICLISVLIGIAMGLGLPSCLAYFADSVHIENRGRIGGITFFAAHLGMFLIQFLTSVFGVLGSALVFALWRALGFIVFQAFKNSKLRIEEGKTETRYRLIASERQFILFIIPWIMFCLVNFFESPLQEYHWGIEASTMVSTAEFGIASISALIGGCFADTIGRKRLVILGYILLGIGYAMLSIFPENEVSIGIYAVFDGIAWGLFALMFFTVIWGDLAGERRKEKYYLLGSLPFLISGYMSVIVAPFAKVISFSASFSLASFFLFLAVLPLMYAPETLPEKKIRERELKDYIGKAKKTKEKYT